MSQITINHWSTALSAASDVIHKWIREAAKKVFLLIAGPLRPDPPPLSPELNGRWNFGMLENNGPAIKRRTFFCGFPYVFCFHSSERPFFL